MGSYASYSAQKKVNSSTNSNKILQQKLREQLKPNRLGCDLRPQNDKQVLAEFIQLTKKKSNQRNTFSPAEEEGMLALCRTGSKSQVGQTEIDGLEDEKLRYLEQKQANHEDKMCSNNMKISSLKSSDGNSQEIKQQEIEEGKNELKRFKSCEKQCKHKQEALQSDVLEGESSGNLSCLNQLIHRSELCTKYQATLNNLEELFKSFAVEDKITGEAFSELIEYYREKDDCLAERFLPWIIKIHEKIYNRLAREINELIELKLKQVSEFSRMTEEQGDLVSKIKVMTNELQLKTQRIEELEEQMNMQQQLVKHSLTKAQKLAEQRQKYSEKLKQIEEDRNKIKNRVSKYNEKLSEYKRKIEQPDLLSRSETNSSKAKEETQSLFGSEVHFQSNSLKERQ